MGTDMIISGPESPPLTSADTDAEPTGFDYSELKPDVADELRRSAKRIRDWSQNLVYTIFDIGRELSEQKDKVGHGKWLPWLTTQLGWDERTEQRYMRVAEVLGAKADVVRGLELTALYELSARGTPQKTRDDILDRLERGEHITSQMVLAEVKAARQEAKAIAASAAVEERVVERKVDETPETPPTQQGRPDQARAIAESSAVEERVAERKVDEVAAAPHARQSRPDQDRQADAVAWARRAADLILEKLNQGREDLAFLLEDADEHEFVERLRQGLAVRSGQAAMAEALPVAHQSPSRKQGDQEGLTES